MTVASAAIMETRVVNMPRSRTRVASMLLGYPMLSDIRFIRKDGQTVDTAIVRKCFFESALDSGSSPERATQIWNHAMFGDAYTGYRGPL